MEKIIEKKEIRRIDSTESEHIILLEKENGLIKRVIIQPKPE